VAEELAPRRFADVAHAFDENGIWYERVQDYDDLSNDPQALHNQVFREIEVKGGTATLVNHPLRYDGKIPQYKEIPFEVGQHSREVLTELGYGEADIDRLLEAKVIFAPDGD
jgi:crotonobetainyl-CoA:carnitine CoA-transferase CaiB-like acyl-CoA transferase